MEPNRIPPAMPVGAYQTYEIRAPRATHFRPASCAEAGCANFRNGWRVRVEGLPAPLLHAAKNSGRKYTVLSVAEGETWLVFEAGQSCFAKHEVPLGRPELYVVRDGDWRGNPTGRTRTHVRAADWVEDFAEHQLRVAEQVERG